MQQSSVIIAVGRSYEERLRHARPERVLMHVDYQVSQQDYVSAAMLAVRKGRITTKIRYYYFCAFAIFWLVATLSSSRSEGHWNFASIVAGLSIFPFLAFILWVTGLKFAREFRQNVSLHGIHQLDATESGMRIANSESEMRSTWKTYSKFAENSRVFILFHPGIKSFIPISKNAMNVEQVSELRSLFKTSLSR
jgi:hypothetical protein